MPLIYGLVVMPFEKHAQIPRLYIHQLAFLQVELLESLARHKCDPLNSAPQGAEPLAAFYERIGQAWQEILARSSGQHVLVVGHAGTVRMILAHMLGLPYENVYRINVGNAGLTRIRVEWNNGVALPTLLFHGGVCES